MVYIYCKDITLVIRMQQIKSDKLYRNAIQANFSHEYCTPLNNIISNSKILIEKLQKIEKQMKKRQNVDALLKLMSEFVNLSCKLNKQVFYSGQILNFHNQNQIERMKRWNNEFELKESSTNSPEDIIEQIIQPFEMQMDLKKLRYVIDKDPQLNDLNLYADWRLYQLALFNILQNAVKFNNTNGKILIEIKLRRVEDMRQQILETIITDTGIGIIAELIPTLFKPFGRLR